MVCAMGEWFQMFGNKHHYLNHSLFKKRPDVAWKTFQDADGQEVWLSIKT